MKTSTKISKLKGQSLEAIKATLNRDFSVLRTESPDKNINFIYLNDKELNSVTLYSLLGKVHKISYSYKFVN
jgi:hypothetical protein